jgi:hypothetical protein
MTFIEGEITIARPAETVFDFAADQRNEPRYNPRMTRAQKVTGRRQERAIWTGMKRYLEAHPQGGEG